MQAYIPAEFPVIGEETLKFVDKFCYCGHDGAAEKPPLRIRPAYKSFRDGHPPMFRSDRSLKGQTY